MVRLSRNERMISNSGKKIEKRSPDKDRKLIHNRKENYSQSLTKKKRSQQRKKETDSTDISKNQRTIWDLWREREDRIRTTDPSEFSVRIQEPKR